jgi:hypothetical protein
MDWAKDGCKAQQVPIEVKPHEVSAQSRGPGMRACRHFTFSATMSTVQREAITPLYISIAFSNQALCTLSWAGCQGKDREHVKRASSVLKLKANWE